MTMILPSRPEFGAPLPVQASPETLQLLARRRSTSAQLLAAPGPNPLQVDSLLTLAARAPDHGKLFPWRFIVLEGEPKGEFVTGLRRIAAEHDQSEKALIKLSEPPLSIVVVSHVEEESKIPAWEQELSAGAVCMNLLIAAEAMGFGANWITDWYGYDRHALKLLGVKKSERCAGFIHIGTPSEPALERVRPELDELTTRWAPKET